MAPHVAHAAPLGSDDGTTVRLAQAVAPTPAAAPAAPDTAEAAPTGMMWGPVKFSIQGEAGVIFNPYRTQDNSNFGQLFTDKANQAQLNQILLGAEKDVDPKATGFDWGFKVQFQYGSDSRYTHFLGELDRSTSDRYQFDVAEADLSLHLPWLTEGGTDVKVGQYPTPIGYEVINPAANPFYSHSYIFNFGIPLKHTGFYAETHVSPLLDLYYGVDSGVNTSLFSGDDNGSAAGLAGLGVNLLDGNLTLLALTHFGPENPSRLHPPAGYRYLNDVTVTWKATPDLTFVTEGNFIRDDAFKAEAYGAAQYVSYALNDVLTLNGRGEVFRDNNNFFVAYFPGNLDYVNAEEGYPYTSFTAARATTYSEFTVGLTYKPTTPPPLATFMVRPELRYDSTLNGTKPYNGGTRSGAFTFGTDLIIGF